MKDINNYITEKLDSTGTKNSNSLLNASDFSWVIDKIESYDGKILQFKYNKKTNELFLKGKFCVSDVCTNLRNNGFKHRTDTKMTAESPSNYSDDIYDSADNKIHVLLTHAQNKRQSNTITIYNLDKFEIVKNKRKSSWRKDLEKLQDNDDVLNKYMKDNNFKNSNEMLASLSPEKRKSLIDKVMADIMKDI